MDLFFFQLFFDESDISTLDVFRSHPKDFLHFKNDGILRLVNLDYRDVVGKVFSYK
jgi:hypothetical protein